MTAIVRNLRRCNNLPSPGDRSMCLTCACLHHFVRELFLSFKITPLLPKQNRQVFKIAPRGDWQIACRTGYFAGSAADLQDGFIHLSAFHQLAETAQKHFSGQDDLIVIAFDAHSLGDELKWEPSRGGDLFPHLYSPLPAAAALWTRALPLDEHGVPKLPGDLDPC